MLRGAARSPMDYGGGRVAAGCTEGAGDGTRHAAAARGVIGRPLRQHRATSAGTTEIVGGQELVQRVIAQTDRRPGSSTVPDCHSFAWCTSAAGGRAGETPGMNAPGRRSQAVTTVRVTGNGHPPHDGSPASSDHPAKRAAKLATSTFPPLKITPTRFPSTGTARPNAAAAARHPVGSTTIFMRSAKKRIA